LVTRTYLALFEIPATSSKFETAIGAASWFSVEAGGAMAEVGLLPFARIALEVRRAVLPRYRRRLSNRQFTQPQLLAILSRMR
jgi:hypothetical protein